MRPSLKIGIFTLLLAILAWFISNLIAYFIGMSLIPRFELVYFLMGVVGLIIMVISFIAGKLKTVNKKYKLAIWVMVELICVIIIVFGSFVVLLNMPGEQMVDGSLKIDYLGDSNDIITDDYNFIFYR